MSDDWESFFDTDDIETPINISKYNDNNKDTDTDNDKDKDNDNNKDNDKDSKEFRSPTCSDIYISTKTKISYLNKPIQLNYVFWEIPLISYTTRSEGVIKKQMKFNSSSEEELNVIQEKVKEYDDSNVVEQKIIMQMTNPSGRNHYKDIRKISIGLRKKDIVSNNSKNKSAFYNCFVVVLRINYNVNDCNSDNPDIFHEINAKVFNTGKIEIPGIKTKKMLDKVLILLTNILNQIKGYEDLQYIEEKNQTVLINSNFNCGYYINREKLINILKFNYNINCAFDPCSYPGILCEFYYDTTCLADNQTGRQYNGTGTGTGSGTGSDISKVKVSFMIFRTGSVLIVGKCDEEMLNNIYLFIKKLLEKEYLQCYTIANENDIENAKNKQKTDTRKKIKKNIIVYLD